MDYFKSTMSNIIIHLLENYFSSISIVSSFDLEKDNISHNLNASQFDLGKLKQLDEQGRIVVQNKIELKALIAFAMRFFGNNINLNFINTSQIKDMSYLFSKYLDRDVKGYIRFNDFEQQEYIINTNKFIQAVYSDEFLKKHHFVKRLCDNFYHFHKSDYIHLEKVRGFNGLIEELDTSLVENMDGMFFDSHFDRHNLVLNMENVITAKSMFERAFFSLEFTGFNANKLTFCNNMFKGCSIKKISLNFENAIDLSGCFYNFVVLTPETIEDCNFNFKCDKPIFLDFCSHNIQDVYVLLKNPSFLQRLEKDKAQHILKKIIPKNQVRNLVYLTMIDESRIEYLKGIIKHTLFNSNFTSSYFLSAIYDCFENNLKNNDYDKMLNNRFLHFVLEKLIEAKQTNPTKCVKKYLEIFKEVISLKGLDYLLDSKNEFVVSDKQSNKIRI